VAREGSSAVPLERMVRYSSRRRYRDIFPLSEPKREPPTQAKVSRSKGDGVQRGINSPPPRDAVSGVGGQRTASSEYLENTSTEGERSAPPPVRVVMKEQIVRATPGGGQESGQERQRER
jgi:hypothetical protein